MKSFKIFLIFAIASLILAILLPFVFDIWVVTNHPLLVYLIDISVIMFLLFYIDYIIILVNKVLAEKPLFKK